MKNVYFILIFSFIFFTSCNSKVELKLKLEEGYTVTTVFEMISKSRFEHKQFKYEIKHIVNSVMADSSYQITSEITRIVYKSKEEGIYFDSNKPEDFNQENGLANVQKQLLHKKFNYVINSYGVLVSSDNGMKLSYSILPIEFAQKPIRMGSKWHLSTDTEKNSRRDWFSVNSKEAKSVKIEASQSASMNFVMSITREQAQGFYFLNPETNLIKTGKLLYKNENFGDMVVKFEQKL